MRHQTRHYWRFSSTSASAMPKNSSPYLMQSSDDGQESLLTRKAYQTSLSAPRAPPHDTAHRALLLGKAPDGNPWVFHHDHGEDQGGGEAHSRNSHSTLRKRLWERLRRSHYEAPGGGGVPQHRNHSRLPHPHLPAGPEVGDQITRWLGVLLPLKWQNACRDSGAARSIFDTVVPATAPLVALSNPSYAVPTFVKLSSKDRLRKIRYGPHERQVIDFFVPTKDRNPTSRLVIFVHGGAWGSGYPWYYRLIAQPFLEMNWAVAVPGYRTYPDGRAPEQVSDCELAIRKLESEYYPDLFNNERGRVTLMGHSSGAHIALLLLVNRIIERRMDGTFQDREPDNNTRIGGIDSFVGISGPYDISHHFDYEAARGVEEFSPMKPVCGYTREAFRENSPALRLKASLAKSKECEGGQRAVLPLPSSPPKMLLVHGIEDETVPFTATAEAARIVRSCGVTECHEMYVAETGHQDTVMHLMLGGRTRSAVIGWLVELDESGSLSPTSTSKNQQTVLAKSKL